MCLQETHSSLKDEQKGKDDFKGPLFFHMEKVILVVCQSAFGEQKLLKWLTRQMTKMDEF